LNDWHNISVENKASDNPGNFLYCGIEFDSQREAQKLEYIASKLSVTYNALNKRGAHYVSLDLAHRLLIAYRKETVPYSD